MKIFKFLFLATFFSALSLSAQKKEERIIKQVKFETDKIILNKKLAFKYILEANHFSIIDLDNREIISGEITSLGDGKFSSIITFVEQNKKFSNPEIIGRNDLFFKMLEENVITVDFKIDSDKLEVFFNKYNEFK